MVKYIDLKEFLDDGYLQELNRQFLHPLGLALEMVIDDDSGEYRLGGVWDYRDDPEGMLYHPDAFNEVNLQKQDKVAGVFVEKASVRNEKYGWIVQPIEIKEG